jgi:hypothetical protein
MGENSIIPSRFCNRHLFLPYLLRSFFLEYLELQGVVPKDVIRNVIDVYQLDLCCIAKIN